MPKDFEYFKISALEPIVWALGEEGGFERFLRRVLTGSGADFGQPLKIG